MHNLYLVHSSFKQIFKPCLLGFVNTAPRTQMANVDCGVGGSGMGKKGLLYFVDVACWFCEFNASAYFFCPLVRLRFPSST